MKRQKLTDKIARTAELPEAGEAFVWDSEAAGFGLRLRSSGARTWIVKKGKKRLTLGNAIDRPVADARSEALDILAAIAKGENPERRTRNKKPKVADLMEEYMTLHVATHCTESTAQDYRRTIDNHILPQLGTRAVDSIVPKDTDDFMVALSKTPGAANKAMALLKAAMQKGMRWGMRTPSLGNPCIGTMTFDLKLHEDYLEAWEFKVVLASMDRVSKRPNRWQASACLRLLAITGCRRDELRACLWDWIDWSLNRINWPTTKTGQGHLVLNAAALELLRLVQIANADHPTSHIFQGENHNLVLPPMTLYRTWDEVKELAIESGVDAKRMARLRPHDLRHSFATLGLSSGLTLQDVGRLLRHRDSRTTERYARFLPTRENELAIASQEFLTLDG